MLDQDRSKDRLIVLFLGSRPSDEGPLALKTELHKMYYRLGQLPQEGRVRIVEKWGVGFADLPGFLDDHQPDIVHFSGHGEEDGYLLFEDDRGQAHRVPHAAVVAQFAVASQRLHCVVLNACHTAGLARQLAQHIDFVVGSQEAIGDRAAIAFAETFYQMLARGQTMDQAVQKKGFGDDLLKPSFCTVWSMPKFFDSEGCPQPAPFTAGKNRLYPPWRLPESLPPAGGDRDSEPS